MQKQNKLRSARISAKPASLAELSNPAKLGRKLTLHFVGNGVPVLYRIDFIERTGAPLFFWELNHRKHFFSWTSLIKALTQFFLGYVEWGMLKNKTRYSFSGKNRCSLAATLGDAISKHDHKLHELLAYPSSNGAIKSCVRLIFPTHFGINVHNKMRDNRDRCIVADSEYLPPDCVHVLWKKDGSGDFGKPANLAGIKNLINYFSSEKNTTTLAAKRKSPRPRYPARYFSKWPDSKEQYIEYADKFWTRWNQFRLPGMSEPIEIYDGYTEVSMFNPGMHQTSASVNAFRKHHHNKGTRELFTDNVECIGGFTIANNTQFLNVVGQPGSGKSTFLRMIGIEAMVGKHRNLIHLGIPVYVELSSLGLFGFDIHQAVAGELKSLGFPMEHFEALSKLGFLLFLFDGIDEIPQPHFQKAMVSLKSFIANNDANRFITSCRTSGNQTWLPQFIDYELAPFTNDQIQHFIKYWFNPVFGFKPSRAEDFNSMLNLEGSEAPLELARTPQLLSFLCYYSERHGRLPLNRADLFEEALLVFTHKKTSDQSLSAEYSLRDLTDGRIKLLLEHIAGPAYVAEEFFFHKNHIIDLIRSFIKENPAYPQDADAETVLQAMVDREGLLVQRALQVYSFSHITFQEYLAARYYLGKGSLKVLVKKHFAEKQWNAIIFLICGMTCADEILLQLAIKAHDSIKKSLKLRILFETINQNSLGTGTPLQRVIQKCIFYYYIFSFMQKNMNSDYLSPIEGFLMLLDDIDGSTNRRLGIYGSVLYGNTSGRFDGVSKLKEQSFLRGELLDLVQVKAANLARQKKITPQTIQQLLLDTFGVSKIIDSLSESDIEACDFYLWIWHYIFNCQMSAARYTESVWENILDTYFMPSLTGLAKKPRPKMVEVLTRN